MYYIALLNFIHVLGSIKNILSKPVLTLLAPATVKNPPVNEKTRENSSPLKGPPHTEHSTSLSLHTLTPFIQDFFLH